MLVSLEETKIFEHHRKRKPVALEEFYLSNDRNPIKLQLVGLYVFLGGTIKRRK